MPARRSACRRIGAFGPAKARGARRHAGFAAEGADGDSDAVGELAQHLYGNAYQALAGVDRKGR